MSPAARSILERLDQLRQQWWMFGFFCTVVLIIAISLGVLVLFISADALLRLPQLTLLALFAIWGTISAVLLTETIRRSLRRQRSLTAAARRVEMAFPELGSHLINLVQLVESPHGIPEPLRQAAIDDAAAHVARFPIHLAATRHSRWLRWRLGLQTVRDLAETFAILIAILLLAIAMHVIVPTWSSSLQRLFSPWRPVPQVGTTKILDVTPGNTTVLIGSRLEITAAVQSASVPPALAEKLRGTVEIWIDGQKTSQPMLANSTRDQFFVTIPAVMAPLQYRLQIGDSETEVFQVNVEQKPTVSAVTVTYRFPKYLNMSPRTVIQDDGDLDAPQFTTAQLDIRSSSPLSKGHVQIGGRQVIGRVGDDPHRLTVNLLLKKTTAYTFHLFNQHNHTDPDPRVNRILVSQDVPPTIRLVKPPKDTSVVPDSSLPIVIRASDDYGLGKMWLEWKVADSGEATDIARRWDQFSGSVAATVQDEVAKPFIDRPTQSAVLIRAVAEDLRRVELGSELLLPQQAATVWRRIELVDADSILSEQLAHLESVQAELWAILRIQVSARTQAARLVGEPDFEPARQSAQQVRDMQVQIQRRTSALSNRIPAAGNPELTGLRQTLANLAHGDMREAVVQVETVIRAAHIQRLREASPELQETQDQIIETLRQLLQFTRKASARALDKMSKRPGGDLPQEVQEQLREVRDRLKEFTKAQKRIIEATKNLAKRPVEDFSEKEEQLFQELAASEDEWARFMEELHSDFSKLPEQDFANASMAEELVEIQTELKMAQDALTKKTADIAVPLEQLGAEMAEEMTTNIEKWLPDSPDRERWSQEEPLTDDMKEAPMAELPGELEDLVGELMEDEEDLLDEMEDISSSWADSLDKGAGWDAADGPISNMSARGVTGNRLPNTSEISGRSGEGRQGTASGEFVGDTAVGKGGRKTPSRLSPDPFVKGQVKDVSKDPVGGATGGGKESGAGGEGLEGPLPQRAARDMQRLAKRQAELRNRAESIDLKFRILNYHHSDLEKMIESMAAVERDLRSGRYRSALRRRSVLLDGLGNLKTYAEGEFAIRRDQSSNLPADVQKDILSSMQDVSPTGWEELNRRYFRRLATEDNEVQESPEP